MIAIIRKNISTAIQIQYLLLLGLLQLMFMIHINIFFNFFEQESSKTNNAPVSLHTEKTTPALPEVKEEESGVFTYQIKKAEPLYNHIILEAANTHNVDLTMIKAIIMAESGYNRLSISRRGAGGLMQLMPATAKSLGVKNIFNPEENIYAGVRYYKSLLNRFNGDKKLALAAYNAGARNVRRHKGVPPFKETRQYIQKVLEYQHFYRYGPVVKEKIVLTEL